MKKTMKTRILSGAMAGVLAMSLAVPAFASGNTKITSTYQETRIDVTVPTTGTAQINPYALNVKLDDTNSISGNQIVTKPLAIINRTEMTLGVSASVSSTVKGGFAFAAAASELTTPVDNKLPKKGLVYLQMKDFSDVLDDDAIPGETDEDVVSGLKSADINAAAASWGEFDATAAASDTGSLLLSATSATVDPVTKSNMVILNGMTGSGKNTKVGGIALFRLAGDVVTTPGEAWAKLDGFDSTVAFTFIPVKTYSITIDSANVTGGTFAVDKVSAPAGAVVTVTGTPAATEDTISVTVTDADGGNVTATTDTNDTLKATFTMPAKNVTITGSLA